MRKTSIIAIIFLIISAAGLGQKNKKRNGKPAADSSVLNTVKIPSSETIPMLVLDDADAFGKSAQNITSIHISSHDPFISQAVNNFSPVRFHLRGYDADHTVVYLNGSAVENIEKGYPLTSIWSGLNDVSHDREEYQGLINNTFSFGGIGSSVQLNMRPYQFKKHSSLAYSFSNGMYAHKISFTHATAMLKNGWSSVFSISRRWADEGYVAGTYFDALNLFIGISKRFGLKHDLSLVAFNNISENGRQGFVVAEMDTLAGSHYYNPFWGYQNGKKRNANIINTNQPYFIVTHDFRISHTALLISSVAYSSSNNGSTFLDWYNAADPRPDYYRYLPSYQTDPYQKNLLHQLMSSNEKYRQINWQHLYDANRASIETVQNANGFLGSVISGKRSHYLLAENVSAAKRLNINSTFNKTVGNHLQLTAGISFQSQNNRIYKKANDLLGGDFYVDLNQFAERTFPSNSIANQNDLNRPNRIIAVGDQYGWDYNLISTKIKAWAQAAFTFNHVDFFMAAEEADTKYIRQGNVMSGLFPANSFGKSPALHFPEYGIKFGLAYKINGRHYLYANAAVINKAPDAQNVFVSAKTRNEIQGNLDNEDITSVEAGYILQSPQLSIRFSGFYTRFDHQLDVINYYDDDLQNFVNDAINGISKIHYGIEWGMDAKIIEPLHVKTAVSIGKYYYNNRPEATITIDNTASIAAKEIVYLQYFNIGGMPQQAYNAAITYQFPNKMMLSISENYFGKRWMDINPIRRTYRAVQNTVYGSEEWNNIIRQPELTNQFVLDVSGSYSMQISKKRSRRKMNLFFNANINNVLNNQNIQSGASEQFRFDFTTLNINKFPPKYYHYYGLNFMLSTSLRF